MGPLDEIKAKLDALDERYVKVVLEEVIPIKKPEIKTTQELDLRKLANSEG